MDVASIEELGHRQDCVARRDQILALVSEGRLRAELAARRWRGLSATVVCLHNGPLTRAQQYWAAVLSTGTGAALAGRSALELAGLTNWTADEVHVLVAPGGRIVRLADVEVVVHQSRTYRRADVLATGPPRTTAARSAVDAATWSRSPRTAAGIVTAVVQQGLADVHQLRDALERARGIRHAPLLRATLDDIAGGAQSLAEIDFGKLCQRYRLPVPIRQVVRLDSDGRRRYLDALLVGPDGREVGVEIDGAHHMATDQWDRDLDRSNDISIGGTLVLRFTATAIRTAPGRVAAQLQRALGIP